MGHAILSGIAVCLAAAPHWAYSDAPPPEPFASAERAPADSRIPAARESPADYRPQDERRPRARENEPADNRTVLGNRSPLLAAGSTAIRAGSYDEGIRLTQEGLEQGDVTASTRAAALSNLCAAYAAKRETDRAIEYCDESLSISSNNWRAYSNRAYAYWLKGMYSEATFDLDAAASIAPNAAQVREIRGMLNEARLQPQITVEDHQ